MSSIEQGFSGLNENEKVAGYPELAEVSQEDMLLSSIKEEGEDNQRLLELLEKVKESALQLGESKDGEKFTEITQAEGQLNEDIERFASAASAVYTNFSAEDCAEIARKQAKAFSVLSNIEGKTHDNISMEKYAEEAKEELEKDAEEYATDLDRLDATSDPDERKLIKNSIRLKLNALEISRDAYIKTMMAAQGGTIDERKAEANDIVNGKLEPNRAKAEDLVANA